MDAKCISKKRIIIINIVAILFSTIFAIIAHAILPASFDVKQLDSIFVEWFGFPAVATFYFFLLFTQCAISIRYIGVRTNVPKLQTGIRFGVAFAMIYLLGMQEVVVEGSPFSTWGIEFVKYQLIIGIGDAIPVIILSLTISYYTINKNEKSNSIHKLQLLNRIKTIVIIAIVFFIERTICYETGLVSSNCDLYAVPCYVWTGLFGVMMGCIYVILYPLLAYGKKLWYIPLRFTAIIGINWIIFNSFISLVMKDTMPQMLLRSGLDVAVLFLASTVVDKYVIRLNNLKKQA